MRWPGEDHRHQRGPRGPGQDQEHLRRRHRLLAGREDELVQGPRGEERREVRHPRIRTLLQTHGEAETYPLGVPGHDGRRNDDRGHRRVLRVGQCEPLQDPVQIHAQPLLRPDHLPRMRRQPAPEGGPVCESGRQDHPRVYVHDHRRPGPLHRHA